MPEVTITYKKPETLKVLKGLAKYLDFKVSSGKVKKNNIDDILIPGAAFKEAQNKSYKIKGVAVLPPSIIGEDMDDVTDLFKDVDAAKLRKEAWQRKQ